MGCKASFKAGCPTPPVGPGLTLRSGLPTTATLDHVVWRLGCVDLAVLMEGRVDIEAIDNDQMPKALGPYSHAVRAGDLYFISGQPGIDPETGDVPAGDFDAEGRMAFENLRRVLETAGLDLDRVVKTTIYLTSADDFPALNALFGEFFPTSPPTRATPIVALPRSLRISIEAVAAR